MRWQIPVCSSLPLFLHRPIHPPNSPSSSLLSSFCPSSFSYLNLPCPEPLYLEKICPAFQSLCAEFIWNCEASTSPAAHEGRDISGSCVFLQCCHEATHKGIQVIWLNVQKQTYLNWNLHILLYVCKYGCSVSTVNRWLNEVTCCVLCPFLSRVCVYSYLALTFVCPQASQMM